MSVTKDEGVAASYVDGQICVTNGGSVPTENLSIIDNLSMPPSQAVIASVNVDTSANPVLDPGESFCYDYTLNIPANSLVGGATYKDTADITITNHSGHLSESFGPNPSATSVLSATPEITNGTIHVDDTNGDSWTFSNSDSVTYDKTFSCEEIRSDTYDNTATIRETDASDSASVLVDCFDPIVTKTAQTSLDRTYTWNVEKSGDQTDLLLAKNESFDVHYTVTPSATSADSNWSVSGEIIVYNNAPIDAVINGVTDIMDGDIDGDASCPVSFPYTLLAGDTLVCTYSTDLPNGTTRTNTATAIQQNFTYDSEGTATENGTTDYAGTASVNFANATVHSIDLCANVSDDKKGALGQVCANQSVAPFAYTLSVGPYDTCGAHTYTNTATLTTVNTQTVDTSSWNVHSTILCPLGCTLTIGYWKNHAGFGPQTNVITPLLPRCLGSSNPLTCTGTRLSVSSTQIAVNVLGMKTYGSASNGITKLYAQLLAAKLNIANGASNTVGPTITLADAFLATNNYSAWDSLSKANKNNVLALMSILDNYNNGLQGVPHCSQ